MTKTIQLIIFCLLASFGNACAQTIQRGSSTFKVYSGDGSSLVLGGDRYSIEFQEHLKKVVWLWGDLELRGTVDELFVLSGHVKLMPGSNVTKSMTVVLGTFEIYDGAGIDQKNISWRQQTLSWQTALFLFKTFGQWGFAASIKMALLSFWTLFLWLLGVFIFRAMPSLRARTELRMVNWKNLPWAVLGFSFLIGATILLVISLVGIVILPFWCFTLFWLIVLSYLGGASWVGHRLSFWNKSNKFSNLSMFVGVLCLQLIWCVESGITPWILTVIWALSWGAFVRSFFRKST